jgi:hypothetical protein
VFAHSLHLPLPSHPHDQHQHRHHHHHHHDDDDDDGHDHDDDDDDDDDDDGMPARGSHRLNHSLQLAPIIQILVQQCAPQQLRFNRLTAITWLQEIIRLGQERLQDLYGALPC